MPVVRSCIHCYRIYCPDDDPDSECCESCRSGLETLEAEIAASRDGFSVRASALRCLDRLHQASKRRRAIFPPASLSQLLTWLNEHPAVMYHGPTPDSAKLVRRVETFVRYTDRRLWFSHDATSPDHYIPLDCLIDHAGECETDIEFDAQGFSVEKFGVTIRVEYLP